jgi:hypothetical protein
MKGLNKLNNTYLHTLVAGADWLMLMQDTEQFSGDEDYGGRLWVEGQFGELVPSKGNSKIPPLKLRYSRAGSLHPGLRGPSFLSPDFAYLSLLLLILKSPPYTV